MAKKRFWRGIRLAALLCVLAVGACKGGLPDRALDGRWLSQDGREELALNKGTFETAIAGDLLWKGTYTTLDGKITRKTTGIYGTAFNFEAKWYTQDDLKAALIANGVPVDDIHGEFEALFPVETGDYTVKSTANGATLTLKTGKEETTYTKK